MIPPEELTRMVEVFALKQERLEEIQKETVECIEKIVLLTGELEETFKGFISYYYEKKKTYDYDYATSSQQTETLQQDNTNNINNRE